MGYKRKRFVIEPDWADLQPELFDLVLQKLSLIDKFHSQGVCKSWRSIAKKQISDLFGISQLQSSPFLLMDQVSLFNLKEQKLQKYKDLPRKFNHSPCIGSLNGFLIFLDNKSNLYLFNPVLDVGIKTTLPGLSKMIKAILWANPILNNNNYGIVAIYSYGVDSSRIAYSKCGDTNWFKLEGCEKASYCDIICCKHILYALSESCSVEAWDFREIIPKKILNMHPRFPQEAMGFTNYPRYLYFNQYYLIESQGELLMVKRYIGYHVRDDGLVVREADMIDQEHEGYEFRYMTKSFQVFKLDFSKLEWVDVLDLGDRVIFLGGNQSVMVPSVDLKEYEKNSIYYTDDNWEQMEMYCDIGGHDTGLYRLKDGSLELFYDSKGTRQPPFWVISCSM